MSQAEFLARLVDHLNADSIPFMVAGSLSSSLHGEPRATNNLDLVIEVTPPQLERFVTSLREDYHVSEESAQAALAQRSMFNVIDFATGWKADLIIRKDRPFSVEEFQRRIPTTLMNVDVFVATPEDTILTKLEWAKMGESDRQMKDAVGVARVQSGKLDESYLLKWANQLGVKDELQTTLDDAAIP